ncbi:hypothetical protein KR215_008209, partial [Drosophila sulfurigaster]
LYPTMKFLIVFVAICAVALAIPTNNVETLKYDSDVQPDGYKFSVETSDGTKRDEVGVLNNPNTDHESLAVSGNVKYIGDDGVTYDLSYTADENGFHPSGAHLP